MTLDEQTALADKLGKYKTVFGGEYSLRDDCKTLAYYDPSIQDVFILTYEEVLEVMGQMDQDEYEELMDYA